MSGNISLGGLAVLGVLVLYIPYRIIVGEKETRRPLGYVAENCPQCKVVRTVQLNRVGLAQSVFGIPLGEGTPQGFSAQCVTCASVFEAQAMDYLAFEATPSAFPPVGKTNPRLNPENRTAQAAYERACLIRTQFLRAKQAMVDRYEGGAKGEHHMDLPILVSVVATCGLPIWLGYTYSDTPLWIDAALFGLGIVVSLFLVYTEPRRYFGRELTPALAKALASLKPSGEELEACLQRLKLYGDRIGNFVTTPRLLEEISAAGPSQAQDLPDLAVDMQVPDHLPELAMDLELDKDARGMCPNCESEIPLNSPQCPNQKCNALFGPHSAWQVRPV